MQAKFLFLGTGGSAGIPQITCKCAVCLSLSPFNKRLRPSALLTVGKKFFLIDVGPDFHQQALHYGIDRITGVLLTHPHYDHVGGLDELRIFYFKHKIRLPLLASSETLEEIKHRFHYLFNTKQPDGALQSQFDFRILPDDFGQLEFEGLKIHYMSYYQAGMKVTGFRFGSFAYISDIRQYEERIIEDLQGVDILVLSALRHTLSEMHFTVEEAIHFSRKVGAKRTFLTHIAHDLEHEETNKQLPPGICLAHDGLEITLDL